MLARHPPTAVLEKPQGRAVPGMYLHKSGRTSGASCVGVLRSDGVLVGVADRVTVRAALAADGLWSFPSISGVEVRARTRTTKRPAACGRMPHPTLPPRQCGDDESMYLPENYIPWGDPVGRWEGIEADPEEMDSTPWGDLVELPQQGPAPDGERGEVAGQGNTWRAQHQLRREKRMRSDDIDPTTDAGQPVADGTAPAPPLRKVKADGADGADLAMGKMRAQGLGTRAISMQ